MFWPFRKKMLKSKVLILCGIPASPAVFRQCFEGGESDFIRSLRANYGVDSCDEIWRRYAKTAKLLEDALLDAKKKGATVIESASLGDFQKLNSFDAVVVIAHHSDNSDEIELDGKMIPTRRIIEAIPLDANAVIDLTSCYSSSLLTKIKVRVPQCTMIGIDAATALSFRLLLLGETLTVLCGRRAPSMNYRDALVQALRRFPKASGKCQLDERPADAVRLGSTRLMSTVYAPNEARCGDDFMVSVFIHKPKDSQSVELLARTLDSEATLRNKTTLRLAIKPGDWVDFQLSCAGNDDGTFEFDENKKGIAWDNDMASVEFCVSVAPHCKKSAFIGKLKIAVNKRPAGEMLFKTGIIPKDAKESNAECTEIRFVPYDQNKERQISGTDLLSKLNKQLDVLTAECADYEENDERRSKALLDMDICRKCIELISDSTSDSPSKILKVFVSSTSDLVQYRKVMREQIVSCEMYPDMYECWGQGNDYPRDKCCKHVLESDIFVCILGAKYGFVEPAWGMSMTEIEFRVAMKAGKPILVYIYEPYKEEMQLLLPEHQTAVERQKRLIDELRESRMVSFFSNEMNLSLLSLNELLAAKKERSSRERTY